MLPLCICISASTYRSKISFICSSSPWVFFVLSEAYLTKSFCISWRKDNWKDSPSYWCEALIATLIKSKLGIAYVLWNIWRWISLFDECLSDDLSMQGETESLLRRLTLCLRSSIYNIDFSNKQSNYRIQSIFHWFNSNNIR